MELGLNQIKGHKKKHAILNIKMYIMAAGEWIAHPVAAAVHSPEVDYESGGAVALGHKPSWGTLNARFVPAPDNSLFEQPFNEHFG